MNKVSKNINYFLERREGFDRLFLAILKKYKVYGEHVNGKVILRNPTKIEKESISSFIGKDYRRLSSITVSFRKIETILCERGFDVVEIRALLEQYFGYSIITEKEEIQKKREKFEKFLRDIRNLSKHPYLKWYCDNINLKSTGYQRFIRIYNENQSNLKKQLQYISTALELLDKKNKIRLSYFSSKVTGNPHAFDKNTNLCNIFLDVIKIAFEKEGNKSFQYETKAEQEQELLLYVGILKDDINNKVDFTGLKIWDVTGHPSIIYKECFNIGKVNIEPLREVVKFTSVRSYWDSKYVFVVEGSGIFSTIIDETIIKLGKVPPFICTNGQFRVAAIKVIGMLINNGYKILYSGDHDPKGVLMAQQLYNRFGDKIIPWGYTQENFIRTTSIENIPDAELPQLNGVAHPNLQDVKQLLLSTKIPCFQEDFTDILIKDIVQILK